MIEDNNEFKLDDDPCILMDDTQSNFNLKEDKFEGSFLEHVVPPLEIDTYSNTYFSLYPNLFDGLVEGNISHDDSLEQSS